jgi:hypothetical protein
MRRIIVTGAATLLIAYGGRVHADPPKTSGDADAAQGLFYEARSLMKEGRYALACPKLEDSLRLDYGIGTEFNLADCNEKLGKLAAAWSGFVHVASAAKAQSQAEREMVAHQRARALEPRVPKLVIEVPTPPTPGLQITHDGMVVDSASWGSPMPIDPGLHRITASAPGKESWQGAVSATERAVVRISVPRDLPAMARAAVPVIETAPAIPVVEPRQQHEPFPEPIIEQPGRTQRAIGWILGGLGVAGIGVGAGFGIDSLQKRGRSEDHCVADRCDARGVSLRDSAIQSGDVATIATVAGGTALVGGVVLLLTAPRVPSRKEVPPTSFRVVPHVAAGGGGLSLQGVLP